MSNQERCCPSCGSVMECKLKEFSIGADGSGGLFALLSDQYEVDLYACPQCGKVELYTANFSTKPPVPPYWCNRCGEERYGIECPECGQPCISRRDHLRQVDQGIASTQEAKEEVYTQPEEKTGLRLPWQKSKVPWEK